MPDISLITSLYRSDEHLPTYIDAVEAVAKDLEVSLEVVIVANDATDSERHLLDTFALTDTLQVTLIYCPRETLYASWNRGIQTAQSDVLGFWNVDDFRTVDGLRDGYLHLHDAKYVLADFAFTMKSDDTQHTLSAPYAPQLLGPKSGLGPFFMFHRNLYDAAGAFNENFRIAADYEWSKRSQVMASTYYASDVIAGDFILHENNLSGGNHPLEWVEFNIVLIWLNYEKGLRPVNAELMRQTWEQWGHEGGYISDETAKWLWGEGAQLRYEQYMRERQRPQWIRRIHLALARRGILKSVEWDSHHR